MIKQLPGEDPVNWLYRIMSNQKAMNQTIKQAIERNFAKDMNVYMADEKGIFQLFQDSSRKYLTPDEIEARINSKEA